MLDEVFTVETTQKITLQSLELVEGVLTLRELTKTRDADIKMFVKVGEVFSVLVLRQIVGKDTDTVTHTLYKKRLEARKEHGTNLLVAKKKLLLLKERVPLGGLSQ